MKEPDGAGYFQPRVMRHRLANGTVEFAIHDVFFRADGGVEGYTQAARSPRAPTVADLKAWIETALLRGVPVACGDLGYVHDPAEHFQHWLQHIDEAPLEYGMASPSY